MPEELDEHEANAREEGWTFDRAEHIEGWRKQGNGWPGMLTPENARIMHVARMWWAMDSLELAQQVTGFDIPASQREGIVTRLGMAYRHWRERAESERRRER